MSWGLRLLHASCATLALVGHMPASLRLNLGGEGWQSIGPQALCDLLGSPHGLVLESVGILHGISRTSCLVQLESLW